MAGRAAAAGDVHVSQQDFPPSCELRGQGVPGRCTASQARIRHSWKQFSKLSQHVAVESRRARPSWSAVGTRPLQNAAETQRELESLRSWPTRSRNPSSISRRPSSRLLTGSQPKSHSFLVDAQECRTSPGLAGRYTVGDREFAAARMWWASSLIVVARP
jgi:hypothetical protein